MSFPCYNFFKFLFSVLDFLFFVLTVDFEWGPDRENTYEHLMVPCGVLTCSHVSRSTSSAHWSVRATFSTRRLRMARHNVFKFSIKMCLDSVFWNEREPTPCPFVVMKHSFVMSFESFQYTLDVLGQTHQTGTHHPVSTQAAGDVWRVFHFCCTLYTFSKDK